MSTRQAAEERLRRRLTQTLPGRDVLFTVFETLPPHEQEALVALFRGLGYRLELRPQRLGTYAVLVADLYCLGSATC